MYSTSQWVIWSAIWVIVPGSNTTAHTCLVLIGSLSSCPDTDERGQDQQATWTDGIINPTIHAYLKYSARDSPTAETDYTACGLFLSPLRKQTVTFFRRNLRHYLEEKSKFTNEKTEILNASCPRGWTRTWASLSTDLCSHHCFLMLLSWDFFWLMISLWMSWNVNQSWLPPI